ncbi:hypothetical protein F4821DRAFT_249327 [Hypoxylon rubiginosum]|uniref:Uncharacterized protein n=1 Tax=Hypoxylon rubiginosum TaxID=110542 RepID=A0ACC0CLT7_9PEZI|nr:hypothetical protein F4821DRAFT_249327 [Hypoxylon rubiginosum]
MSDAWFSNKLAPGGDTEDGCHPAEAEALKKYLRREIAAEEAARAISQPIVHSNNPGEDLPRLWALLIDALIELPSDKIESLITLAWAIENLPDLDMAGIEESKRPAHGKLWRGLPGFGHLYADIHQSIDWREKALKADATERSRLREYHVRKAEIEARLAVARLASIPIDWGYETVADALESRNAMLDFQVPAAAEWLEIAGSRFMEGATKGEGSWALDRPRDLWEGGKIMTVQRYSFWRDRLEEVQTQSKVTLQAAKKALEFMERELKTT